MKIIVELESETFDETLGPFLEEVIADAVRENYLVATPDLRVYAFVPRGAYVGANEARARGRKQLDELREVVTRD